MRKPNHPRVTAWRLIALSLDDYDDAKADYARAILGQIDNNATDVITTLADIAADHMQSRFGRHAYAEALREIERLVIAAPEPQRTPRPHRDRPIRRNK